jgi:hypothetical protein
MASSALIGLCEKHDFHVVPLNGESVGTESLFELASLECAS